MVVSPKPCSMNAAVAPPNMARRLASLRGRPTLTAGAGLDAISCLLDRFDTDQYRIIRPTTPASDACRDIRHDAALVKRRAAPADPAEVVHDQHQHRRAARPC